MFNERTGTAFNDLHCPTDIVMLVVLWRERLVSAPPMMKFASTFASVPPLISPSHSLNNASTFANGVPNYLPSGRPPKFREPQPKT